MHKSPQSPTLVSLAGLGYFPLAMVARLPFAMMVIGVLTLVVAARGSVELGGINSAMVGLGTACVAIAACLLIPTYYVNPGVGNAFVLVAFTIVVLGGMGSTVGVVIAAFVLTVAPELLRSFSEYRVLLFGVLMVLMMIWRPRGLIRISRTGVVPRKGVAP